MDGHGVSGGGGIPVNCGDERGGKERGGWIVVVWRSGGGCRQEPGGQSGENGGMGLADWVWQGGAL